MRKYIVRFSGQVEVSAVNKDDAMAEAWTQHGVHDYDVTNISEMP